MKKIYSFVMMAILSVIAFVSCEQQDFTQEQPEDQPKKYITVGLECVGDYLEVDRSPLSKTHEKCDGYFIEVYTLGETFSGPDGNFRGTTSYASGTFSSLEGVTINLLEGHEYRFCVGITVDYSTLLVANEFSYSNSTGTIISLDCSKEGYYGVLDEYTPNEGSTVVINTKRISYGVNFIAEGLTEGRLRVSANYQMMYRFGFDLEPATNTYQAIYTFPDYQNAWRGVRNHMGYDENGIPIYEYENYYEDMTIEVIWLKGEGNTQPLGTYNVRFERNVRTTVRIRVEENSASNGISINKDMSPIVNDDHEYILVGGSVQRIPIQQGNN